MVQASSAERRQLLTHEPYTLLAPLRRLWKVLESCRPDCVALGPRDLCAFVALELRGLCLRCPCTQIMKRSLI